MPSNKKTQDITKRLDVIIKFLLIFLTQDKTKRSKPTLTELIDEFRQLGFQNQEIAPLLGKTNKQISDLFSLSKKRKKKETKKKK